jgi:predicted enzyme related to lactoylglutathione lyase
MKFVCTLITVEDIDRSRNLYEGVLKQKIKSNYGENIIFTSGFAIHDKKHYQLLIENRKINNESNSFELYFEEDDIESIQNKIIDMGLEIIHMVKEQPWRQKAFRFYDYDNNIIEIGESLEHLVYRLSLENEPIENISRITGMSIVKVKIIIGMKGLLS